MQLGQILDHAIADCHGDLGTIQVYDAATATLTIARQRGHTPEFLDHFRVVRSGDGSACGRALRAYRVTIDDVEADAEFAPHREAARSSGFRAVHSATVLDANEAIAGIISVHYRQPNPATVDYDRIVIHARAVAKALEGWPDPQVPPTDSPVLAHGPELTAAERVRAAFSSSILPDAGGERGYGRDGPPLEVGEQLAQAIIEYARHRREHGANAEALLVELKSLLYMHPKHRTPERFALSDRAITLAIKAYYTDKQT